MSPKKKREKNNIKLLQENGHHMIQKTIENWQI